MLTIVFDEYPIIKSGEKTIEQQQVSVFEKRTIQGLLLNWPKKIRRTDRNLKFKSTKKLMEKFPKEILLPIVLQTKEGQKVK